MTTFSSAVSVALVKLEQNQRCESHGKSNQRILCKNFTLVDPICFRTQSRETLFEVLASSRRITRLALIILQIVNRQSLGDASQAHRKGVLNIGMLDLFGEEIILV